MKGREALMTEEQIERMVQRRTDAIDRRFMAGKLTQEEYDAEMAALSVEADRLYAAKARGEG